MPDPHTPRQIGDLAMQMQWMDHAALHKLVDENILGIHAVAVMAAQSSGFSDLDDDT